MKVCPKCSALVNVKLFLCACGHCFAMKRKAIMIIKNKKVAMKCLRALYNFTTEPCFLGHKQRLYSPCGQNIEHVDPQGLHALNQSQQSQNANRNNSADEARQVDVHLYMYLHCLDSSWT